MGSAEFMEHSQTKMDGSIIGFIKSVKRKDRKTFFGIMNMSLKPGTLILRSS